jgi:hypothetical protein
MRFPRVRLITVRAPENANPCLAMPRLAVCGLRDSRPFQLSARVLESRRTR